MESLCYAKAKPRNKLLGCGKLNVSSDNSDIFVNLVICSKRTESHTLGNNFGGGG
jgi:hypothetical protein